MDNRTTRTEITDAADASLVAMAKVGDPAAMDQLVGKYWVTAYQVAMRILRSHEDAEEVAQDAIWAALTHLSAFREDACFRTWLHRIAVNHSLMALRRRRVRTLGSPCPLSDDRPPAGIHGLRTPEDLLLEKEFRTVVEDGLSRVPFIYSAPLRLASCEDRSIKEIAEHMGISTSAVKTRLNRGRAHLRRKVLPRLCVNIASRKAESTVAA